MGVEQTGEFGWIRKEKIINERGKKGENEQKREKERNEKGFLLLFKIYENRAVGFRQSNR